MKRLIKRIKIRKYFFSDNDAFLDKHSNIKKYIKDINPILQNFKILKKMEDEMLNTSDNLQKQYQLREMIEFCDKNLFLDEKYKFENHLIKQQYSISPKTGAYLLFLSLLTYYLIDSLKKKGQSIFKKKKKKNTKKFSDVLGIDEYLEEIKEIVDFFRNPDKYNEIGAELPKGILMVGAPGVGKTLLAKALAGESECEFIYIAASSVEGKFIGQGSAKIRNLFERARKSAPCIIFFDEFDSIASKRDKNFSSNSGCLNEILSEMDGFQKNEKIFVIASTNFPDALDPAVIRPGRFDKIIKIPLPSLKGREEIIEYYLKKIKYDKKVTPKDLAKSTINFTGSDIRTFINLAILNAIKNKKTLAEHSDFDFALDRMNIGIINKSLKITKKEKYMTAIHEAGHTLMALLNPNAMPLNKVTILSKGGSLGHTSFRPIKDLFYLTKGEVKASLEVAMGGRVAEEIFFGKENITTGCGSDLNNATQNGYKMSIGYGFGGFLICQEFREFSELMRFEIDRDIQGSLRKAYDRCFGVLMENKDMVRRLAEELVMKETMDVKEVKELLGL